MRTIKIKEGLDLPIKGSPKQEITDTKMPIRVAILGDDYAGLKPTMAVTLGDKVKLGQLLFTDKKMPGVKYTSPGAGKVVGIHRGPKRRFLSVVVELDGDSEVTFKAYSADDAKNLSSDKIKDQLLESGLWTAMRSRPFGKVANPADSPHSIFINGMDTKPLAPSVPVTLKGKEESFKLGVELLSKLVEDKTYVTIKPGEEVPVPQISSLEVVAFDGPHPAGLPGTHIHFLDPAGRNKTVWHVDAQHVAAIGVLFSTGKLNMDRIVAIAGPSVNEPRLIKTRVGARISEIVEGELSSGENRIISGSVLSGFKAEGPEDFLGFFEQLITVLPENRKRYFLGWLLPPFGIHSIKNLTFFPGKNYNFDTALNGALRPIVPIGSYEKVMPLDIIPNYLLRALAVEDVEESESLGCLELVEEDLALCTYVCPSKVIHGENLRRNLTTIEKEG